MGHDRRQHGYQCYEPVAASKRDGEEPMKHRLTLVVMIGFSVLSLVGTILVSASNHATTKSTSPSTRPEGPRPSERHETFCVSPALRKPGKATLALTQLEAER